MFEARFLFRWENVCTRIPGPRCRLWGPAMAGQPAAPRGVATVPRPLDDKPPGSPAMQNASCGHKLSGKKTKDNLIQHHVRYLRLFFVWNVFLLWKVVTRGNTS